MFTCKVYEANNPITMNEYSVTKDEKCVDIKNNVISVDSKIGRTLYDHVNSNIDSFTYQGIEYVISNVIRYNSCNEMKRYNSSQGRKIQEIIKQNKVKYLVHFTNIENLTSILDNGILSVNELNKRGLSYINNDFGRYDGRRDCSCFSVEFPNISLINSFNRRQDDTRWIVLLIDAEVLIINEGQKYFCVHNAASSSIRKQVKYNQLTGPDDFKKMFADHIEFSKRSGKIGIDRTVEKSYLTTSGQGEILISGPVHCENIRGIVSNTNRDKKEVDELLKNFSLSGRIDSVKEQRYFINRDRVRFKER